MQFRIMNHNINLYIILFFRSTPDFANKTRIEMVLADDGIGGEKDNPNSSRKLIGNPTKHDQIPSTAE